MGNVARVTEINAKSEVGFEDAIRVGVERAAKTVRQITSAWVKDHRVEVEDGKIVNYQVNMLITFVLED